jgi:hypothetical protein
MKIALLHMGDCSWMPLPRSVLEQLGFGVEAELTVEDGRLVLEPVRAPRQGWAAVFAAASGALTAEDHDWLGGPLAGDA